MNFGKYLGVFAAVLACNAAGAKAASDVPLYRDGVLTIPSVSIDGQVGKYQDAVLEPTTAGTWRLKSLLTLGEGSPRVYTVPVESVEVVKTSGVPVQVLLRVQGWLSNGCSSLGRVSQQRVGNAFQVLLADGFTAYDGVLCAAVAVRYLKTFPLDVYGLSAGTYTYEVNGVTGSFELSADNSYPGDCQGPAVCPR